MERFLHRIEVFISLPKSLYLNFILFPFRIAIKLPILIKFNVALQIKKRTKVTITDNVKTAMICIGFNAIGTQDSSERTILNLGGNLYFHGCATIGQGTKISCSELTSIIFGENFQVSGGLTLICEKKISIGRNVLIGWNTTIMDCDYHETIDTNTHKKSNISKEIYIGDNVWQAMNSIVLKGSYIPKGSIIGAGAVVSGKFEEENILIAGNPARVCKHNITRLI